MDLDALVNSQELQTAAHRWVLDGAIGADVFRFGVQDTAVVLEKRRQPSTSDVAPLIDCGRQHCAPVFTIPNRVIRAATEEGNAERSSGNNHIMRSLLSSF